MEQMATATIVITPGSQKAFWQSPTTTANSGILLAGTMVILHQPERNSAGRSTSRASRMPGLLLRNACANMKMRG